MNLRKKIRPLMLFAVCASVGVMTSVRVSYATPAPMVDYGTCLNERSEALDLCHSLEHYNCTHWDGDSHPLNDCPTLFWEGAQECVRNAEEAFEWCVFQSTLIIDPATVPGVDPNDGNGGGLCDVNGAMIC